MCLLKLIFLLKKSVFNDKKGGGKEKFTLIVDFEFFFVEDLRGTTELKEEEGGDQTGNDEK